MSSNPPRFFRKADGLKYFLEERFHEKREDFPLGESNYVTMYKQIEDCLNREIHPNTVLGAAVKGDGLLNDHGVEHITMVIQRAGLLLGELVEKLTGYEIFILLVAIHFHDVGNTGGRDGHETRIFDQMEGLGTKIPLCNEEKVVVTKIAMAHGGHCENGDKDTIKDLRPDEAVQGHTVRSRLLAAILRFADEIADDHTRANRYFKGQTLPPQSKVFHEYSQSLQPAHVKGSTLSLAYYIEEKLAKEKTTKGQKDNKENIDSVYLYDEIIQRLNKCLCELEYCAKYAMGFIQISTISVKLCVKRHKMLNNLYEDSFKLELSGYPTGQDKNSEKLIKPYLKTPNGEELANII